MCKDETHNEPRKDETMRTEFVEVETKEEAETACPWAAIVVEVEGGHMAFESMADYETWEAQR